mgnify:CR=1 FL=1
MDSKTHIIGGLQYFTLFITILWLAVPKESGNVIFPFIALSLWFVWLLIDQRRIAIFNKLEKAKPQKKTTKKSKKSNAEDSNADISPDVSENWSHEDANFGLKTHLKYYSQANYAITIVSVLFISIFCKLIFTDRFGIIIIGYLLAFIGASLPDLDAWVSIKSHRDPITHSSLLPSLLFLYFFLMFSFHSEDAEFLFVFAGLILGYASHLLFDVFPLGSSIKEVMKIMFSKEKGAPGDIRHLPEKLERGYLTYCGFLLIAEIVLTILKILSGLDDFAQSLSIFRFPTIDLGITETNLIFLVLFAVLNLIPMVILIDNWNETDPKARWNWLSRSPNTK